MKVKVGGKRKRGAFQRPVFEESVGSLLLLLGLRSRRRLGRVGRRAGRAAAEVRGIVLVVQERRAVVGLVLDPGVRVAERGLLALVLPHVEASPLRILPELLEDPLRRPRR